jgi:hypothetical protein
MPALGHLIWIARWSQMAWCPSLIQGARNRACLPLDTIILSSNLSENRIHVLPGLLEDARTGKRIHLFRQHYASFKGLLTVNRARALEVWLALPCIGLLFMLNARATCYWLFCRLGGDNFIPTGSLYCPPTRGPLLHSWGSEFSPSLK